MVPVAPGISPQTYSNPHIQSYAWILSNNKLAVVIILQLQRLSKWWFFVCVLASPFHPEKIPTFWWNGWNSHGLTWHHRNDSASGPLLPPPHILQGCAWKRGNAPGHLNQDVSTGKDTWKLVCQKILHLFPIEFADVCGSCSETQMNMYKMANLWWLVLDWLKKSKYTVLALVTHQTCGVLEDMPTKWPGPGFGAANSRVFLHMQNDYWI